MNRPRLLLLNPRITSRRSARFPLSLLSLAGALEASYECRIIDGNIERRYFELVAEAVASGGYLAVGISVMGGPQVRTAIDSSLAVRQASPATPIIWGGYFPTLYKEAAINAPYVDYLVRGGGEEALRALLGCLQSGARDSLASVAGLTFKAAAAPVHAPDRPFADRRAPQPLPYELLGDPRRYLARTFMGARTAAYQAALGCRFRCTFCGVAAVFNGATALPPAERLRRDLTYLKRELGADSVQYFDHNFFDREVDMLPLLEVMAEAAMPWWCYARADALLGLSPEAWQLVRRSRLKMAYIGAETASAALLKAIRKGTRVDQTLEVTELCRRHGVVPELSFMVAPPDDPEGETERTFELIRHVKRVNPAAEIIVYYYTPLPASSLPHNSRSRAAAAPLRALDGTEIVFPGSPDEWTEPRWVDYACHANAPWVSARLHRRIQDFVTVLGCRFPTVQDVRAHGWSKLVLRSLAAWRYHFRRYDRPWELALSRRLIRLADPKVSSL